MDVFDTRFFLYRFADRMLPVPHGLQRNETLTYTEVMHATLSLGGGYTSVGIRNPRYNKLYRVYTASPLGTATGK